MDILRGDCLDLMRCMEDDSVDLVFTSPPYEDARTYDMGFSLRGDEWVEWALERYLECVRVCKGLVAWVVEGKTRKFRWSATPALLMAELHKHGVSLRKPPVYHRVGIPGSGGPDWLRNDYEFIVCSSKGRLPWSDNTAMGKPPKYAPGGEMSHRLKDGGRVAGKYKPPKKANPGNVFFSFGALEAVCHDAILQGRSSDEILRVMRQAVETQGLPQWLSGVYGRISEAKVLQQGVQGCVAIGGEPSEWRQGKEQEEGTRQGLPKGSLRHVRNDRMPNRSPSQGREHGEQQPRELSPAVRQLSPAHTQEYRVLSGGMRTAILRERVLQQALPAMEEIWRSFSEAAKSAPPSAESGDVVTCVVGGGNMGSKLSSLNEAPFPESLAEFFVRSFCPEGGFVLDPFCGSGTTLAVAKRFCRRGVGMDVRESQVDLAGRRIEECESTDTTTRTGASTSSTTGTISSAQ